MSFLSRYGKNRVFGEAPEEPTTPTTPDASDDLRCSRGSRGVGGTDPKKTKIPSRGVVGVGGAVPENTKAENEKRVFGKTPEEPTTPTTPDTEDMKTALARMRDSLEAHRVWWIYRREHGWTEHHVIPAETRSEINAAYPDALVIMSDREAKADPTKMKMRGGSK